MESGFDAEPTFEIKDDNDEDEVQVDPLNPFDSVDMDEPVHPDAEDSITVGEVLVTMFAKNNLQYILDCTTLGC